MIDAGHLHQLITDFGYLAILAGTFLEGETIVIIAGYLSTKGMLNPWLVALCAFSGSFCSDQLMFMLGRYKGPSVLKRFPRLDKNTEKARRLLLKYETVLILGFRFVYGVRNVTPILLGTSGVSHLKFLALNFIGGVVWALTFTFAGYYFGRAVTHYMENIANVEVWIIGGVVALAIFFWWRSRRRNAAEVRKAVEIAKPHLHDQAKPVADVIAWEAEKSVLPKDLAKDLPSGPPAAPQTPPPARQAEPPEKEN